MDALTWKQRAMEYLQKYKYAALILLTGIFLMVLPGEPTPEPMAEEDAVQPDLQQSLTRVLSRVEGAGKVEVLLTEAAGERTVYQSNEERTQSDNTRELRRETVLVTDGSREEGGLVKQVIPPTYQGAVILCQGADQARVRLAMVRAVASVTGLTSDKITVLKMK